MNPLRMWVLGGAVFVLISVYAIGRSHGQAACTKLALHAQRELVIEHNALQKELDSVSAQTAKKTETSNQHNRAINQELIRYVKNSSNTRSSHCVLDADGVRLWNSANAGYQGERASARDGKMPDLTAASLRNDDRFVEQSYRGHEFIPSMQDKTRGAHSVDKDPIPHENAEAKRDGVSVD